MEFILDNIHKKHRLGIKLIEDTDSAITVNINYHITQFSIKKTILWNVISVLVHVNQQNT